MTVQGKRYETSSGAVVEIVKRQQVDGERWCWFEVSIEGEVDRGRILESDIVSQVSEGNWDPLD